MRYIQRSILLLICLIVLFAFFVGAQEKLQFIRPNLPVTFPLSPNQEKSFSFAMKQDDFSEFDWLVNDSFTISLQIIDSSGKIWLETSSIDNESMVFVAPKEGEYTLVIKFDKSSEIKDTQNISLEYKNKFNLPVGARQKDIRSINGYDVKIMSVAKSREHFVLIEKNGRLKKVLHGGDLSPTSISFGDDITQAYTPKAKRGIPLVKNTIDKTGDGIPDVMITYFSGGAHCCFETEFINLGEYVETVDSIDTGNVDLIAIGKSSKGGLIFETADNSFAYWLTGFANSPFPSVVLEFQNGKLRPNFELMKKPAPSLTTLRDKALVVRRKMNLEPYKGEDSSTFETAFWDVMLDLIYTGHEDLAWKYLDLVWSSEKQGKAIFREDFKNRLAVSWYAEITEETRKTK